MCLSDAPTGLPQTLTLKPTTTSSCSTRCAKRTRARALGASGSCWTSPSSPTGASAASCWRSWTPCTRRCIRGDLRSRDPCCPAMPRCAGRTWWSCRTGRWWFRMLSSKTAGTTSWWSASISLWRSAPMLAAARRRWRCQASTWRCQRPKQHRKRRWRQRRPQQGTWTMHPWKSSNGRSESSARCSRTSAPTMAVLARARAAPA
mmetsp:Transcript_23664/g.76071  ORF Transcript_23664/g.76071 Transcript_23664/m.76071 type:complete len:204 (-) Transcript_23664:138-749(-)